MDRVLLIELLKVIYTVSSLTQKLSQNEEILQALVDQARRENRDISIKDVQKFVFDMSDSVNEFAQLIENTTQEGVKENDR